MAWVCLRGHRPVPGRSYGQWGGGEKEKEEGEEWLPWAVGRGREGRRGRKEKEWAGGEEKGKK